MNEKQWQCYAPIEHTCHCNVTSHNVETKERPLLLIPLASVLRTGIGWLSFRHRLIARRKWTNHVTFVFKDPYIEPKDELVAAVLPGVDTPAFVFE